MQRRNGLPALAALIITLVMRPAQCFLYPLPPIPPGGLKTAPPASRLAPLYSTPPPNNWKDLASRFYNELVPWGDSSKGLQTIKDKKDAMIVKYMQKTGCSKEEAEKEVTEYLQDKDGYVKRKRAEEAEAAKNKKS